MPSTQNMREFNIFSPHIMSIPKQVFDFVTDQYSSGQTFYFFGSLTGVRPGAEIP